ncbi:auxin-responsive protein SAUR68-like [Corylus avellana]|uniref:auxin-responsive protein SAUR68-like n=1 Tax=Corylus avellana TaxID=13451 RepID=UPI00286BC280|nr:auxin-responsive protein SAUR68-like [Corylus avellana]
MISLKKLIAMVRKWKKMAGINGRRSIPWPLPKLRYRQPAHKGHFVVYTADMKRFVVPLPYLSCKIFKELFRMSEEEFGLPTDGPITLPCDAAFMECVISVVRSSVSELDKAISLASCTASVSEGLSFRQISIHGF